MEVEWSRQAGTPTSPKILKQRLSVGICRILAELPHSSKLERRNHVGPWRIPAELPRSSYEDGSRQAGSPFGPQCLATLPTRLRLSTTLRMRAPQVECPNCGVCSNFHRYMGIYRGLGGVTDLVKSVTQKVVAGRPCGFATTNFLHCLGFPLLV
jgi:hypothetical protein